MKKLFYAINLTLDGFADHTAGIADDELHEFFADYLDNVDTVLMGRKTYKLMADYWPIAHEDPRNTKITLRFADKYNSVRKIIFTNTLKEVKWQNSRIADKDLVATVKELKEQAGKNISIGSLSLASQLLKQNMIDEYWFLVQPIIIGSGRKLFEGLNDKRYINLVDTQTFNSGVVVLHYEKR